MVQNITIPISCLLALQKSKNWEGNFCCCRRHCWATPVLLIIISSYWLSIYYTNGLKDYEHKINCKALTMSWFPGNANVILSKSQNKEVK